MELIETITNQKRIFVMQKRMIALVGSLFSAIALSSAEAGKIRLYDSVCPTGKECHTVRSGEFLIRIARERDMRWERLMLANEVELRRVYETRCGKIRQRYTKSKTRRGHYCLERADRPRPWANSLKPGDMLVLPAREASAEISATVAAIAGQRIALVIDDTGSMYNDRRRVAEMYAAAVSEHGKKLAGVWLYADNEVRKYEAGGVSFRQDGGTENTHAALRAAAESNPDAIVLITDEPGDDWDWAQITQLPPVVAHCLPNEGQYECRETLMRLETATSGRYIQARVH